jgi:outer membrane protein OmpA-like peptidoglycan-associated protein
MWRLLATALVFTVLCLPHSQRALAQADGPAIPFKPGLTIVLAVHAPHPQGKGIAHGDYEMVVSITDVNSTAIVERTRIDSIDEAGTDLHLSIERRVMAADVATSRLQILGFHTDDPAEIPGTTSLGPSRAVVRDLRTTGSAIYSLRNFKSGATSAGKLIRVGTSHPFPVLVNGKRVELPAIRVTGQLRYHDKVRPWEHYILDHPDHPLTLRFAHGGVGEGSGFEPELTREIVRIDFPVREDRAIEDALSMQCRAEVPGIYFDFDRATLNPQSNRALTLIADLLQRKPQWRVSIEGHTDNVGTDRYNLDLSARRAAAVKTSLVRDFRIRTERLTTAGFGDHRPVETNDTIAGRARNRRVELVRDCIGKQ